ncbi:MAG TPA: hypothetical protein VNA20_13745 [Frankiaceae bacterium]|nr:hypothetical protein [Frankiaceae bacterium]
MSVERAADEARRAGKNIGADARELGEVTLSAERPQRAPEQQELADRALALLREEIARMRAQREEFAAERGRGAPAKASPRLDAMAARLEGASRFALRMGLVTPNEAREIWHEAAQAGLHDRPSTGRAGADEVRGGAE